MAPPVRRSAAPAPVSKTLVSFGSMDFYSGSRSIPEGDYTCEFAWQNFQPMKQDGTPAGASRLVVMATLQHTVGGNPIEFPFGTGQNTHESYQPDPDNPKSLLAVPGGPGANISKMTNWAIFLGSLYAPLMEPEHGLPQGVLDNDFSVLDGIELHIKMEPEPEQRKNMPRSTTAELQGDDQRKGSGLIPMVHAILARPWEGAAPTPAPAPVTRTPVNRTPAAPKAPAAPARTVTVNKAAVTGVASNGLNEDQIATVTMVLGDVFAANPDGLERNALRMEVFKKLQAGPGGAAEANAIVKPLFGSDTTLDRVIQPLSYMLESGNVVPML